MNREGLGGPSQKERKIMKNTNIDPELELLLEEEDYDNWEVSTEDYIEWCAASCGMDYYEYCLTLGMEP